MNNIILISYLKSLTQTNLSVTGSIMSQLVTGKLIQLVMFSFSLQLIYSRIIINTRHPFYFQFFSVNRDTFISM